MPPTELGSFAGDVKVKKHLMLVICALALVATAAKDARAITGPLWEIPPEEKYFPLHIGSSWTYSNGANELTFTITGAEQHNNRTYYVFSDYFMVRDGTATGPTEGQEVLLRYDPIENRVMQWLDGQEGVRYDLSLQQGESSEGGYLRQDGVDCNVPAGSFHDCKNFAFGKTRCGRCGPDAYGVGEYLAPDVGDVRYVRPGGKSGDDANEAQWEDFQLQTYTVTGPTMTLLSDMDWSGRKNSDDIQPFVLAVTDPEAYIAQYGRGPDIVGDASGDGLFNCDDINPFTWLMTGGSQPIPEPATLGLLAAVAPLLLKRSRR